MKDWYEIRNAASPKAEVWIYEDIGENWWGEGLTAKKFVSELNAITAGEIDLHVNSYGGSVFDGHTIYNALVRHPANVTTYIDGVAASIASVVALAGDTIIMPANAMLMIHDPLGMCCGGAEEMRSYADVLEKVRDTILNVYAEHSTKTRDELSAAMTAETWMTADDAVEYGFISEVAQPLKMAAHSPSQIVARFKNAPAVLYGKLPPEPNTPAASAENAVETVAETVPPERDWVPVSSCGRLVAFPPRSK